MKRKSQSLLESTLAYAAGMLLLGAAIAIWATGNAQIPARQITYEVSRIMAGSPNNRNVDEGGAKMSSKGLLWPTYVAAGF